jgi:CPA2 family monovalent cation:H+ antiporter-2/glutathione-regulated potassium-efflux system protein KefB
MDWRRALALGLLLSQGGEFGFVLFTQAQTGGVIGAEAASLFGAVVTLSMATTPFLMMATRGMRTGESRDGEEREGPRKDGARALVVGYGRFGQTVAQMLIAAEIEVTLIDTDTEMIDVAGEFGAKVYFGDGTRLDLLRQAGAGEAALICFCIDGRGPEPAFLRGAKEAFPHAAILVRAFDRRLLVGLREVRVDYVVREVMESAVAMARAALDLLGDSEDEIDRAEEEYRQSDRERLELEKVRGDVRAGRERIITQPTRR